MSPRLWSKHKSKTWVEMINGGIFQMLNQVCQLCMLEREGVDVEKHYSKDLSLDKDQLRCVVGWPIELYKIVPSQRPTIIVNNNSQD